MKPWTTLQVITIVIALVGCDNPTKTQPPDAGPEDSAPPANGEASGDLPGILSKTATDDDTYVRIRENFHKVETGMTKSGVADIIGFPRSNRDTDRWTWEFTDTGMADKETYVVEFSNGVVSMKYGVGKHYARPEIGESPNRVPGGS